MGGSAQSEGTGCAKVGEEGSCCFRHSRWSGWLKGERRWRGGDPWPDSPVSQVSDCTLHSEARGRHETVFNGSGWVGV